MKILIIGRFKPQFTNNLLPFVLEQGEALSKAGHQVEHFPIKGNYLSAVKSLKAKIKSWQPDIIHAHYGLSAITAELQSLTPVVTTFHNGETLNKLVNFSSSLMSLRASHVIYVAEHIYNKCYFKSKNYSIIPCGINLEDCNIIPKEEARKQLGLDPNKIYILFGGGFDNLRKNYPLLKEGVMHHLSLQESFTPKKGDRQEDFGEVVCMEMKGFNRAECNLRMCACDIFALPSKSEGSPQALKEAMACNCPIVATDIADVKHLLGGLPGHYLCDFSKESVAEALRQAIEFCKTDNRTNGRERIIELGLDNDTVAKKLIAIYNNVLKK